MTKLAAAAALLLAVSVPAVAADRHPVVDTHRYLPGKAITQFVGTKQVVGYFDTVDAACKLTLVVAEAGDETLTVVPTRVTFKVGAADVAEFQVDAGKAMRIGCSSDADMVKIAVFDDLKAF